MNHLTDQINAAKEILRNIIGNKVDELTLWQIMCEMAALEQYRQDKKSIFGDIF